MPAFFHNRLLMLVLMLGMGLGFASAVYAETEPAKVEVLNPQHDQAVAPQTTLAESAPVRAELLERLQDRLIELEKETAVLKAELGTRIDAQDNRIADGIGLHGAKVTELSNQTSMLGVFITVLAVLVAIVGILGGVFAFKRAEQIAKEQSEQWFKENDAKLREEIDQLATKASQACDAIDEHREDVENIAKVAKADIEKSKASFKFDNDSSSVDLLAVYQESKQGSEDKPCAEWSAEDFHLKAGESFANEDYAKALEALSIQIYLLEASSKPEDELTLAKALFNKGITLGQLNRPEDELAVYEELIRRFGVSPEAALREWGAKALLNKGVALGRMNRPENELAAYDELINCFSESLDAALSEQVASALLNKGLTFGQMNRPEMELATYDELISRFSSSNELAISKSVATAFLNKGVVLGLMGCPEDELVAYNELIERFSDSPDPTINEQVVDALFFKGVTLGQLNRPEEARGVFKGIVRRFGDRIEPALLKIVERARRKLGDQS